MIIGHEEFSCVALPMHLDDGGHACSVETMPLSTRSVSKLAQGQVRQEGACRLAGHWSHGAGIPSKSLPHETEMHCRRAEAPNEAVAKAAKDAIMLSFAFLSNAGTNERQAVGSATAKAPTCFDTSLQKPGVGHQPGPM